MTRQFWVLLHRYAGLVMALFLLVAGLTGSLLAFYDELDVASAPGIRRVAPPSPGAPMLDPLVLRERVIAHFEARYPGVTVGFLPLRLEAGQAASFNIEAPPDPRTRVHPEIAEDEIFVDPYTGRVLGARKWGDVTQGPKNLMPFVYRLHYSLALDSLGVWLMGIVALIWTLDCFIGFYLTLPVRIARKAGLPAKKPGKSWWSRWKPAWLVRRDGGAYKLNFDLHRAGGLWVWAMLFVLAWSSVGFNLREPVFNPVMKALFQTQDHDATLVELKEEQFTPGLSWADALRTGRALMAREAQRAGIEVGHEQYLYYDHHHAVFGYAVHSDRDVNDEHGRTKIVFDANTGALKFLDTPTGQAAGNTVAMWLYALHMAQVWGLPFRIFVCAMGLVVAMLCVTGVVIWLKKRKGRAVRAQPLPVRKTAPSDTPQQRAA